MANPCPVKERMRLGAPGRWKAEGRPLAAMPSGGVPTAPGPRLMSGVAALCPMIGQIGCLRSRRWPGGSGGGGRRHPRAAQLATRQSATVGFALPERGWRHTGLMRVVVTESNGMAPCGAGWWIPPGAADASPVGVGLVTRALAIRPLYRPVPESPLYHVQVDEWGRPGRRAMTCFGPLSDPGDGRIATWVSSVKGPVMRPQVGRGPPAGERGGSLLTLA